MNKESLYNYKAEVLRIIDGDTVEVLMDLGFDTLQKRMVRLLGFDASETRTKDLVEKAIGKKQRFWLSEQIYSNEFVYIHTSHKDSFGRYLGIIYDEEGNNINERFIERWPSTRTS